MSVAKVRTCTNTHIYSYIYHCLDRIVSVRIELLYTDIHCVSYRIASYRIVSTECNTRNGSKTMLLQLSDWQRTTTSLSLFIAPPPAAATTKRRRSKASQNKNNTNNTNAKDNGTTVSLQLPVALSFVPPPPLPSGKRGVRPSKRKKLQSTTVDVAEVVPILAVTTAHGIHVLGTTTPAHHHQQQQQQQQDNDDYNNNNNNNTDEEEPLMIFQESTKLQYTSRPGTQSAFLSSSSSRAPMLVTSKSGMETKHHHLTHVPACFDTNHDRVYALQGENSVLVSWMADAEGPTTNDNSQNNSSNNNNNNNSGTAKFTLPKPAVSMSVGQVAVAQTTPSTTKSHGTQALVYGTLCDHRFYVGSWSADGTTLRNYLFDAAKTIDMDGHRHVCTMIATPSTTATTMAVQQQMKSISSSSGSSGSKRKLSSESDGKCVLTQVFATEHGFLLLNHKLLVTDDSITLFEEEEYTGVSRLSVVSQPDVVIDTHCILHAHAEDSIVVAYQQVTTKEIINGKKQHTRTREHRACHISLDRGVLLGEPFEISGSTRHVGFVGGETLLAAGTIDAVLLYEVERGTLVRSISVSEVVADTKDWIMITDSRRSSLALLSVQPQNAVHVAMATVVAGDISQGPLCRLDLADGLRCSMISNSHLHVPGDVPPTKNLLSFLSPSSSHAKHHEDETARTATATTTTSHAVQDALASLHACIETALDPKNDVIKSTALLDAYEAALAQVLPSFNNKNNNTDGPTSGTMGAEKVHKSFDNETLSNRGITPPLTTPQEFVDGAVRLMLATLQLPRTESKVVGIRTMIARLDARLILYRLLRSGKVSARCHFQIVSKEMDDDNDEQQQHYKSDNHSSDCDILLSILRATKLTNKRGRRVVSPVDLIHEMLSNCTDLTERHLVTMLHYVMCKALPHDIAENCLGWKCFDDKHDYTITSRAYFRAMSAERILLQQKQKQQQNDNDNGNHDDDDDDKQRWKELQETIETLSAKLVRIGLVFLVERIVTYSKVNTSLLRTALADGLTHNSEAPALARILLHVLGKSSNGNNSAGFGGRGGLHHPRRELHTATAKWIFVLCEACRDTLSIQGSAGESSKSHLEYILDRLEATLEDSTIILSLGPSLESMRGVLRYESDVVPLSGHKTTEYPRPKKEVAIPPKLAGYCIEQLIL